MAKSAKLGDFVTPTGYEGNVFNLFGDVIPMVTGAFALLITFAFGQKLFQGWNKIAPAQLRDEIDTIAKSQAAPARQMGWY